MRHTDEQIFDALRKAGGNKAAAARKLRVPVTTLKDRIKRAKTGSTQDFSYEDKYWSEDRQDNRWVIICRSEDLNTPEEILKEANVDLDVWGIDRVQLGKSKTSSIKITLKRKIGKSTESAVKGLMSRLESCSPVVPKIKRPKLKDVGNRRELEICLMDPHYGMRCFAPESDAEWSPELCANMIMDSLELILERAKAFGPFEKIVMPMGNDFFHTDSIFQTTTAGTPQPEGEAYYHTFINGEQLSINIIERMKEVADVEIYMVAGNHDRSTSFMLGRVLKAFFHNDENVVVHADASPYKFHRFGVNLIGYEHGHSVAQIRLQL